MRTPAWIGVDVGTSSLKVVAVGADGSLLAEQETAWAVDRADARKAEADTNAWLRAVDDVLVPMSEAYDVRALGVTGQMHGTILLDEYGAAVRPAVLWPDSRAEDLRRLWDALPGDALARLGSPWSAGMTGPVLAWLAENEPDTLARAERVALPKDLVRGHLVRDSTSTDPSDASGTLLWDVAGGSWSREATALVPAHLLPEVRPSAELVGTWRGAEVVVGGGDTPNSLVTLERVLGGWQPGDVVVNLGTGAQVIDPRTGPPSGSGWSGVHVYEGVLGECYAMVAAQNAGLGLSWAQHQLGITWEELATLCRQAPPGADGVLFSPFVAPERGALSPTRSGPGWITERPSDPPPTAFAARSAVEAQAFLVRRSWELLDVATRRVFVLGGGAREPWVRQLLADVLGKPVDHLPLRSASAAGAAILAGGPTLRDSRPSSATAAPRELPQLDEAYQRWRSVMYGDGLPGLP